MNTSNVNNIQTNKWRDNLHVRRFLKLNSNPLKRTDSNRSRTSTDSSSSGSSSPLVLISTALRQCATNLKRKSSLMKKEQFNSFNHTDIVLETSLNNNQNNLIVDNFPSPPQIFDQPIAQTDSSSSHNNYENNNLISFPLVYQG